MGLLAVGIVMMCLAWVLQQVAGACQLHHIQQEGRKTMQEINVKLAAAKEKERLEKERLRRMEGGNK